MIDLNELERLAAEATPLPWGHEPDENFLDHDCQIIKGDTAFVCEFVTEANAAYITAACNSLPELIAENRELRERVRELERQAQVLAVAVSEYQRCKTCIVRRSCPNDAKGGPQEDCVIAILKWAEQAAKEAGE